MSKMHDLNHKILEDLDATHAFARQLSRSLKPGSVLALEGDLGAGKTTLVRALVEALGGDPTQVSSPTFVLLHVYETPTLSVFHIDAYRIDGDQLDGIGFDELLDSGGVVIVEWASRVKDRLPKETVWVSLEVVGETSRMATLTMPKTLPDVAE
jgi:tRNA threonylcarbamoyladenosine biosynthesis protein TsaE